ncbi:MAG: MCE family protein, partial [Ignavibacteria bacterium]|nr:MCE family protein [Ignavibacteria bacterium]
YNINEGNGTFGRLIRDTILAENLNLTLINLKNSSKGLDENLNAAKHSFLFRGFFKKKAKEEANIKEDAEELEKTKQED